MSAKPDTAEAVIVGTGADVILEQQRETLWQAAAAVDTVALALDAQFGLDAWPRGVPEFSRVLRSAVAQIYEAAGSIVPSEMEIAAPVALAAWRERAAAKR